jgi:hypothetical protein
MPVLRKPGLESAHAEEARNDGTGTLASRDSAASAGCHAPDAGDTAEAACAEEEITEEMIHAGAKVLCGFETLTASEWYWAEEVYRAMRKARLCRADAARDLSSA